MLEPRQKRDGGFDQKQNGPTKTPRLWNLFWRIIWTFWRIINFSTQTSMKWGNFPMLNQPGLHLRRTYGVEAVNPQWSTIFPTWGSHCRSLCSNGRDDLHKEKMKHNSWMGAMISPAKAVDIFFSKNGTFIIFLSMRVSTIIQVNYG